MSKRRPYVLLSIHRLEESDAIQDLPSYPGLTSHDLHGRPSGLWLSGEEPDAWNDGYFLQADAVFAEWNEQRRTKLEALLAQRGISQTPSRIISALEKAEKELMAEVASARERRQMKLVHAEAKENEETWPEARHCSPLLDLLRLLTRSELPSWRASFLEKAKLTPAEVASAIPTLEKLAEVLKFVEEQKRERQTHPADRRWTILWEGGGHLHPLLARLEQELYTSLAPALLKNEDIQRHCQAEWDDFVLGQGKVDARADRQLTHEEAYGAVRRSLESSQDFVELPIAESVSGIVAGIVTVFFANLCPKRDAKTTAAALRKAQKAIQQ